MNLRVGVAGFYKIRHYDSNSELKKEYSFKNMITDDGLNALGARSDYLNYCQIGSGSSSPNPSNSELDNFKQASANVSSFTSSVNATTPYYTFTSKTFEFPAGTLSGSYAEVGVGWLSEGGLLNRSLIYDDQGNQTSIYLLDDEFVSIEYELRYYPDVTDTISTVVFSGSKGDTYDCTVRSLYAGDASIWQLSSSSTSHKNQGFKTSSSTGVVVTPNELVDYRLGANASGGLSYDGDNVLSVEPYVNGSLERVFQIYLERDEGNLTQGIKTIYVKGAGIGALQINFDKFIPKTDYDIFRLKFKIKWGRV